jgi:hypothetical protein
MWVMTRPDWDSPQVYAYSRVRSSSCSCFTGTASGLAIPIVILGFEMKKGDRIPDSGEAEPQEARILRRNKSLS